MKKIESKRLISMIKGVTQKISWILIPLFQFVPCGSVWFGIMSVPLIMYIGFFFSDPSILGTDFRIFFERSLPWIIISFLGGILFVRSIIYQMNNRNKLLRSGPYRFIRHPQYLGIIISTFSLTMISLDTDPVFPFPVQSLFSQNILIWIWIAEVFAYITLAKIEEMDLKKKFESDFVIYKNSTGFILPFLKYNRKEKSDSNETIKPLKNK